MGLDLSTRCRMRQAQPCTKRGSICPPCTSSIWRTRCYFSNLAISGIAPREIRTYLHNHSEALATQRDIYNRIAATKRDLREGQSSIQALVDQLHKEEFWCRIRLDQDNRLTAIFFAHPESVAYLQSNPDVLLLDCTYKTNNTRCHSWTWLGSILVSARSA